MATLKENMEAIKLEKDTKILPENLKSGITAFGVTGTYEGTGGSSVEGVKTFETIEEMNNSTGNNKGDLAIVYGGEIVAMTADSKTSYMRFPTTVTLDTAITTTNSAYLYDETQNNDTRYTIRLTATEFSIRDFFTYAYIVRYTSSDGLIYTLNEGYETSYKFKQLMHFAGTWNDAYSKFIECEHLEFDGLYEYFTDRPDMNNTAFKPFSGFNIDYDLTNNKYNSQTYNDITYDIEPYSIQTILDILNDIASQYHSSSEITLHFNLFQKSDGTIECIVAPHLNASDGLNHLIDEKGNLLGYYVQDMNYPKEPNQYPYTLSRYIINYEDKTFTVLDAISSFIYIPTGNYYNPGNYFAEGEVISLFLDFMYSVQNGVSYKGFVWRSVIINDGAYVTTAQTAKVINKYYITSKYFPAPTQLTLADASKLAKGEIAYGNGQVIEGTFESTVTKYAPRHIIFNGYSGTELDAEIAALDTSNITDFGGMFCACKNLISLDLTSFNTDNVTSMISMFITCSALTSVNMSTFNTSKVTSMKTMFRNCTSLQTIDMSGFVFTAVTDHTDMFSGVPTNCTIYVKDQDTVTLLTSWDSTHTYTVKS